MTGSSDRQEGSRRSFKKNRIGFGERPRRECNHRRVSVGKAGADGSPIEHAGQVLQSMMVGEIVGVAGMVVALRR